MSASEALADMRSSFGMVPSFMLLLPEESLGAAWMEIKSLQLNPRTAIPARYKELIGMAVAAQIPCRYCSYFHGEAAKLNGASEREIKETLAAAALVRHWSTFLEGVAANEATFGTEVTRAFEFMRGQRKMMDVGQEPVMKAQPVTDADSAYRDMERTIGFVPTFMKAFPKESVAAAWNEFKSMNFNTNTALPGKYKHLIGLAVAGDAPCRLCVTWATESARMEGATDEEIHEAVAMAALTRHWSTLLNGSLTDEKDFRRDTDKLMTQMKKRMESMPARKPAREKAAPESPPTTP